MKFAEMLDLGVED